MTTIQKLKKELEQRGYLDFCDYFKENAWELELEEQVIIQEAYNTGYLEGYEYANATGHKSPKSGSDYYHEKFLSK